MPKLSKVTQAEIVRLDNVIGDLVQRLHVVNDRIDKGYCEPLSGPESFARSILPLALASGRLVQLLMVMSALQEQSREIESLRAQKGDGGK